MRRRVHSVRQSPADHDQALVPESSVLKSPSLTRSPSALAATAEEVRHGETSVCDVSAAPCPVRCPPVAHSPPLEVAEVLEELVETLELLDEEERQQQQVGAVAAGGIGTVALQACMAAGRSKRGSFRSVLPSIEEAVEDSDDEEERQDLALSTCWREPVSPHWEGREAGSLLTARETPRPSLCENVGNWTGTTKPGAAPRAAAVADTTEMLLTSQHHPCSISVVSVTSEVLLNSPNPASGDKENLDQNSALADIASPYT